MEVVCESRGEEARRLSARLMQAEGRWAKRPLGLQALQCHPGITPEDHTPPHLDALCHQRLHEGRGAGGLHAVGGHVVDGLLAGLHAAGRGGERAGRGRAQQRTIRAVRRARQAAAARHTVQPRVHAGWPGGRASPPGPPASASRAFLVRGAAAEPAGPLAKTRARLTGSRTRPARSGPRRSWTRRSAVAWTAARGSPCPPRTRTCGPRRRGRARAVRTVRSGQAMSADMTARRREGLWRGAQHTKGARVQGRSS
jgi:hypothetical protein